MKQRNREINGKMLNKMFRCNKSWVSLDYFITRTLEYISVQMKTNLMVKEISQTNGVSVYTL